MQSTKITAIILDLDGPILECRLRHFLCYSGILKMLKYRPLEIEAYWRLKRHPSDSLKILAATGAEASLEIFKRLWLERIETPELLRHDTVQPGVMEKLDEWRMRNIIVVIATMRMKKDSLMKQLVTLNIKSYFNYIAVSSPALGAKGKVQQVKRSFPGLTPDKYLWVGDSEIDIDAARLFKCPIWAVSCGVRSKRYLLSLSPDYLSPDLSSVKLEACHGS